MSVAEISEGSINVFHSLPIFMVIHTCFCLRILRKVTVSIYCKLAFLDILNYLLIKVSSSFSFCLDDE